MLVAIFSSISVPSSCPSPAPSSPSQSSSSTPSPSPSRADTTAASRLECLFLLKPPLVLPALAPAVKSPPPPRRPPLRCLPLFRPALCGTSDRPLRDCPGSPMLFTRAVFSPPSPPSPPPPPSSTASTSTPLAPSVASTSTGPSPPGDASLAGTAVSVPAPAKFSGKRPLRAGNFLPPRCRLPPPALAALLSPCCPAGTCSAPSSASDTLGTIARGVRAGGGTSSLSPAST